MELACLSIAEAGTLYRSEEISPVEVTRACLPRVEERDATIHVFVTVTADLALEQARAAEKALQNDPSNEHPLLGTPICLKDLIDTAGIATNAQPSARRQCACHGCTRMEEVAARRSGAPRQDPHARIRLPRRPRAIPGTPNGSRMGHLVAAQRRSRRGSVSAPLGSTRQGPSGSLRHYAVWWG